MAIRVALTGGGTGGHAYPIVAVAQEIQRLDPDAKFLWIGSASGPERDVAQQTEISFTSVATGKMRRYFSLANLIDIFKIPVGVAQAHFALGGFRPHVVFSKGGFVSYPTVTAAWIRDIPILLHETDSVPGLANRKLSKRATLIATSYPIVAEELPKEKTVFTGNPIRRELTNGSRERALQRFGLSGEKPILVVLGGSQGALAINQVIYDLLPELLPHFQVIHQVGPKNEETAKPYTEKYGPRGYRTAGFFEEELADVYAAADIIVSRAGGQLFELAAVGKPAIVIPLPGSASNHQVMNAFAFQKQSAIYMMEQANLTGSILLGELLKLLHDEAERRRLSLDIRKFDTPLAAQKLAYWIFRIAQLR